MKKVLRWGLAVFVIACAVIFLLNLRTSLAQENEKRVSFNGVMPFYTTGGYFGFFDQKDGTVYVYDEQMKKVLYVYKLDALGSPGIDMSSPNNMPTTY